MTLSAGARLGPYEIVGPLGAGGMGEVYKARDTRLDRTVAIKVLPEPFAADPQFRERFDREARAVSSLDHPNICALYDVGDAGPSAGSGQAVHYLVMQFLEGETLAAKRGLPVPEAIDIARQVALGLEVAHERGIVHRDLKPANVILTRDGTAKILDFGLAKAATGSGGSPGVDALSMSPTVMGGTMAGVILGTAAYMSPEQARGLPVDKRADIWAFGCVLYEMLAGRQAFQGGTVTDIIAAIVTREPDWTLLSPDVPSHVRRLLRRCLQKDPKQRLHDIADARLELSETGDSAVVTAAPAMPARPGWWLPAAIAAALALAIGLSAGRLLRSPAPPPDRWIGTRLGGPAVVTRPRVSPDGQLVAFMTVVDRLSQVGVMKPGGGTWTLLTRDRSRGLANSLSWSSDGARVYYDRVTDAPQGIYSVPALGGEERLVLEDASTPQGFPDGSLAVIRINAKRENQFFRFFPATGRVEALPALAASDGSQLQPLPNGREAVYFGRPTTNDENGLYVLDLNSGRSRRIASELVDRNSYANPFPLAAASDGAILFGARQGDAYQLFRMPGPEATPRAELSFTDTPVFDLAGDGSLYLSSEERPIEAVWVDARGGAPSHVVASPLFVYGAGGLAPLPDGRALVASRGANRSRLLTAAAGRDPLPFIDTNDETGPPMTAVDRDTVALTVGTGSARDVAIVASSSGRIVRRLRGAVATATALAASPDGKTLYYSAAGSIWAMPVEGGAERKICAGDSMTVDPDSGDLIVKLDEPQRFRLQRVSPSGGGVQDLPMGSDLRLAQRPLSPGAVRNGKLLFSAATNDSWYWFVGMLDLKTGGVSIVPVTYDTDFHLATWSADGKILGLGLGFRGTLWRYQPSR